MIYKLYGVFSPKGELEAVETTEGQAQFAAENLSPVIGGKRHVNRSIRMVSVFNYDVENTINNIIQSLEQSLAKEQARIQKILKEASETKSALAGNYWHDEYALRMKLKSAQELRKLLL